MLYPPGFYYVKKPKMFVILSSDKSSERNLFCFFDIIKPRRIENLQSEEPFSSDPYFRMHYSIAQRSKNCNKGGDKGRYFSILYRQTLHSMTNISTILYEICTVWNTIRVHWRGPKYFQSAFKLALILNPIKMEENML